MNFKINKSRGKKLDRMVEHFINKKEMMRPSKNSVGKPISQFCFKLLGVLEKPRTLNELCGIMNINTPLDRKRLNESLKYYHDKNVLCFAGNKWVRR